jgi:hypothetical protein
MNQRPGSALRGKTPDGAREERRSHSRLHRFGGKWTILAAMIFSISLASDLRSESGTDYRVKYVSADAVYLNGGSDQGLAQGQQLIVKKSGEEETVLAQIEIDSITSNSAVGRIVALTSAITPGDVASLAPEEIERQKQKSATVEIARYPHIISFNQDDPLDREVREHLPKPPSPEVNRIRGRIGFDFGNLHQQGGFSSSLYGVTIHMDSTRLGSSYWSIHGYYRGYRHSSGGNSVRPMLVDLVNRTYHLSLNYENPNSRWVAGVGRLFVPWASSLDTIDGFYLGRRFGKATAGIFGGSAPDPTSWDYDPRRQIAGGLINFEEGSYESWRFTSTAGIALTRINWNPDRQFGFFQNQLFYKRYFSIYSDVQCDLIDNYSDTLNNSSADGGVNQRQKSLTLSRSYLTVRFQPFHALSFDASESYFRNLPTFDERLLSAGLLDKYLFQGLSGGFHLDLPFNFGIYSTVGRSSRTGDASPSWDYLAGFTMADILHSGIRADFKYSKFDVSFGGGTYRSLTLARQLAESLQFDLQIGQQNIQSGFAGQGRSRFLNGNLNWFFGTRYYLGLGLAVYRGDADNYRQSYVTLGYRFDNRHTKHE